ncbi:MAG: DUF1392 family protein [Nostoc sp. ChiSLP01]
MVNLINSLETCWYISPPWGQTNLQLTSVRTQKTLQAVLNW